MHYGVEPGEGKGSRQPDVYHILLVTYARVSSQHVS
jgi:hypothetical protein